MQIRFRKQSVALGMLLLMTAGCAERVEQAGGVSGATVAAGKPLPEKTTLTFTQPGTGAVFFTQVDADGRYAYTPASGVPLSFGNYKVTVDLPTSGTIIRDGMMMPDPNWKKPDLVLDDKYRSVEKSPLSVELNSASVVFDIQLE